MEQRGMFDVESRLEKTDGNGDPLMKLNELIDWELFRPELKRLRQRTARTTLAASPMTWS